MDHAHHNHEMAASIPSSPTTMQNNQNEMNHGMSSGMNMHNMATFYHFGSIETILFSWWSTKSSGGILLSSIILILICFLYEGIKWARVCWKKKAYEGFVTVTEDNAAVSQRQKLTLFLMIGDAALHILQLILGYSLMLVFMTFNIWLCAAVVFGEAIAYLVFWFFYPDLERIRSFGNQSEGTCCI